MSEFSTVSRGKVLKGKLCECVKHTAVTEKCSSAFPSAKKVHIPSAKKEGHGLALQMCFSHTILCKDSEWCASIQSSPCCTIAAGEGDLAEVLPPFTVNPVAAQRKRITERSACNQGKFCGFSQV